MRKLPRTVLFSFCTILAVEIVQLLLRRGIFDIDDLILNMAGWILGYLTLSIPFIRKAMIKMYFWEVWSWQSDWMKTPSLSHRSRKASKERAATAPAVCRKRKITNVSARSSASRSRIPNLKAIAIAFCITRRRIESSLRKIEIFQFSAIIFKKLLTNINSYAILS